jgi:hypothetical protein
MSDAPPSSIIQRSTSEVGTHQQYRLTVNAYDRTATLIIALLILVGAFVGGLLVVYFANRSFPIVAPIPVIPVEATTANPNQGIATEPEPPGREDAPDLTDPQLQDTLETLSLAISESNVLISDEMIDDHLEAGKGAGLGDARMAGDGSGGVVERVPRWQRWRFRFEPASTAEFAQWLDFHKIEIGVLGRDNLVHYAYDLSGAQPKTRTGEPTRDNRGYTSAADGPMPGLTMQLARKAGVAEFGSIVLLFYPQEVENTLYLLEQAKAEGRNVNSIRQTVFTVTRQGAAFGFEVIEQKYF